MIPLAMELRDVGSGLASRARAFVAATRRTTAPVLLLRGTVFGALLGACALAIPPEFVVTRPFLLAVFVSLAAAVFPRTRAVGFALIAIAVVWLVATTAFDDSAPSLWRVLGMAAALYIAHAAAAFAAVLPHDCAVAPSALGRWAVRTLLVVAVSVGLGSAGMALLDRLPAESSMAGPIVGSLVAAGLAGVIVWLVRRRS